MPKNFRWEDDFEKAHRKGRLAEYLRRRCTETSVSPDFRENYVVCPFCEKARVKAYSGDLASTCDNCNNTIPQSWFGDILTVCRMLGDIATCYILEKYTSEEMHMCKLRQFINGIYNNAQKNSAHKLFIDKNIFNDVLTEAYDPLYASGSEIDWRTGKRKITNE